jgi:endonuclease YncB( thermonuclease family)
LGHIPLILNPKIGVLGRRCSVCPSERNEHGILPLGVYSITMLKLFYIFIVVTLAVPAFSHGGGLNKEGCHNNRKAGDYHCHRGPKVSTKQKKNSKKITLTGIPKITDGDTIRIGSTRIRLHGIDAPEAKQTCTSDGKDWRCGWEATNALASIVGKHWVTCSKRDTDRYGRVVAVCRAGPINLNAWMVSNGWAVAYRRYSTEYVRDERDAKAGRRGLWRGEFMMPWDWRRK